VDPEPQQPVGVRLSVSYADSAAGPDAHDPSDLAVGNLLVQEAGEPDLRAHAQEG
jgi:hypothetical protein